MTRRLNARAVCAALVMIMVSAAAWAQAVDAGNVWSRGTTLAVSAGMGSAPSDTGPMVGTAVGWEVTPRFAIEGTGSWLDRTNGDKAFAAALLGQVSLMRPRPAAPFVEAGFGFYRASFAFPRATIPLFYRDRMSAGAIGSRAATTFTDPAFVVGAGVNVFATRHIAIRPQVESLIVTRNSRTYAVYTATVRLAYHFEDHPITPKH